MINKYYKVKISINGQHLFMFLLLYININEMKKVKESDKCNNNT